MQKLEKFGDFVKLPNGDVWRGINLKREERPDTLEGPTAKERETDAEMNEAALAQMALAPKADEPKE